MVNVSVVPDIGLLSANYLLLMTTSSRLSRLFHVGDMVFSCRAVHSGKKQGTVTKIVGKEPDSSYKLHCAHNKHVDKHHNAHTYLANSAPASAVQAN